MPSHHTVVLGAMLRLLSDLSLAKLRRILRVHYREKTASEVYQQLATVCQQSSESPQQFLLRALDLHYKVNFASQESDCEFNYGTSLIQKNFVKSFETGLRDDILASNLRPTLSTSELTDEELMRQVNELVLNQAERSSKLASECQKSAKVHECEVGKEEREARAKSASTDGGQQLLLEIRQIKSEINDLKDQVNRRGSRTENSNWRGPSYRGRGHGYQPNRTSWGC